MWIKIKDHLPAEGQQIIAFSPDNGTDYPVSIGFWVSYENGLCDAPDGVVARKFAFTHWQPIPDAPQDGHITKALGRGKDEKLKPCMFCGLTEKIVQTDDGPVWLEMHEFNNGEHWYINCNRCGARGPEAMSERLARKKWNHRAESQSCGLTSKSSGRARYFCVNYHCGFTKKNYCTRPSGTCLRRSLYRVTNNRT